MCLPLPSLPANFRCHWLGGPHVLNNKQKFDAWWEDLISIQNCYFQMYIGMILSTYRIGKINMQCMLRCFRLHTELANLYFMYIRGLPSTQLFGVLVCEPPHPHKRTREQPQPHPPQQVTKILTLV